MGSGNSVYVQLDTGDARSFVTSQNLGISTYELNAKGDALQGYAPGMIFEALTEAGTGQLSDRYVWTVGNVAGPGGSGNQYTHNLLFALNAVGTAIQYPDEALVSGTIPGTGDRLTTNIVPVGRTHHGVGG